MVVVLLIAPATAVAVPSPPHEVFGAVTDQDGDAVEGATVTVTAAGNSHTATTDTGGYYEIKFPAADGDEGETLTVEVDDESETTSFAVGASERIDFDVTTASGDDDRSSDDGSSSSDDSSSGDVSTPDSSGSDEQQSTTAEPTEMSTTDESTPSSETAILGFGPIAAVIALLAVAFVALRRE